MKKTGFITAISALLISGVVVAQESDKRESSGSEERPTVLIEDPEEGEIEIFEAQGSAEADIVSPQEMEAEAEVTAVMENEYSGDMAAMPEVAEDAEW